MENRSKLLEIQLEKCVWMVKEERLRLGAQELSSQHRTNVKRLMDEMRANCREYALLQGAGRADKRRTAIRYSRLFQKAVDDYVATTQLTAPTLEYLNCLENLQENLIQVLKFQQKRKYSVESAKEVPCQCFSGEQKKKHVLAFVEKAAEQSGLRKDCHTQTEDSLGCDIAIEARPETKDQQVEAVTKVRSVGIGDGILIRDMITDSDGNLSTPQFQQSKDGKTNQPDPDQSFSISSSLDNSPSLGDLLLQFRRVLRDETGPVNSSQATGYQREHLAKRRFEAARRKLSTTQISEVISDASTSHESHRDKRLLKPRPSTGN